MIGAQRLTMSAVSPGIVLRSTWTFCVGPNVIVAPCGSRKNNNQYATSALSMSRGRVHHVVRHRASLPSLPRLIHRRQQV